MNAMVLKSKVRYVQSLSQKKVRDADGVFVAEGPKIINELLNERSVQPLELFALKEWIIANLNMAISVTEVDEVLLSRLSHLATPNQVIGIFRISETGVFRPQGSTMPSAAHPWYPGENESENNRSPRHASPSVRRARARPTPPPCAAPAAAAPSRDTARA